MASLEYDVRGDAIKYSEWPPYNVGGQRKINVAYYIGLYIYLYARSIVFDFFEFIKKI